MSAPVKDEKEQADLSNNIDMLRVAMKEDRKNNNAEK